jgi:uncharacterized protein
MSHFLSPFNIITKPIGAVCNLDCEYCYYLEKKDLYPETKSFRMSEEVLDDFTRQYIYGQPANTPEVNFVWQGGEPTLMGVSFFRKAFSLQKKYARPGMNITNSFQTNGTLLNDDWAELFRDYDVLVGISIDGPEEIHDEFRPDKEGYSSFFEVMNGLEYLIKHDVRFNTLTCVQSTNSSYPAKIYRFLKKIGSTHLQFIPIVEPEENGEVSYRSVHPVKYGSFLCGVFDDWLRSDDVGRIFVQDFDVTLNLVAGNPSPLCIHAETCGHAMALEHNGDLFSCDHFVFPEYKLGNIGEQRIETLHESDRQQQFGFDKKTKLPKFCRDCEFLSVCNGGCPKDRIRTSPDGEPGLNYLCRGYKKFYGHSLPVFKKMARCIEMGYPARDYKMV